MFLFSHTISENSLFLINNHYNSLFFLTDLNSENLVVAILEDITIAE